MIIYKTTNLVNGKIYVGKDKNNNSNYYGSGIVLTQAFKKYGKENFKKEILETTDSYDDLNEKEIYWIYKLDSTNPKIGYNRSYGGDGFSGIMPETIEKIRHKNSGQKRTEKQRKNISESLKGKPKSEEHKKSLKKSRQKRSIEKPHTKETLRKMSESMKGKNIGKYVKIYQFQDENNIIHTTDEGLVKFCKSIHKHPQCFRDLIQGKRKEYHGWIYIKTIKDGSNNK